MVTNEVTELAKHVEGAVEQITKHTEQVIEPYRSSVFKRFPTVFSLLVTFGIAAVFFGFERVIADIAWLNTRPWLILSIGILTLAITGTLYKKLG